MLAFCAFLTGRILLTVLAVHLFIWAIPLGALSSFILPAFKIEENEFRDELLFAFVGSEIAQVSLQYVLFAAGTPVLATLVLLLLPSVQSHDFITRGTFPPFFALRRAAGLTLLFAFLV